jgi:methyl-accepting chemotaxis protein
MAGSSSKLKEFVLQFHERFRGALRVVTPARVRSSYTTKLMVGFVAVIILGVIAGGVLTMQTGATLEEQTNAQLESSASTQAELLGQWVQRMEEETRLLSRARTLDRHHLDPGAVNHFLRHEVDTGRLPDEVVGLHLARAPDGRVLASEAEDVVDTNIEDTGLSLDELQFDSADDAFVSDPFRHEQLGKPVLAVVSPVPQGSPQASSGDHAHGDGFTFEGEEHGHYLVMIVDLEQRVDSIPQQSSEGFTMVVDGEGTVVMSHQKDRILGSHMQDTSGVASTAVEQGLDGATGTSQMDMQMGGESMSFLAGHAPVDNSETDWVVVTHIPTSEAFAIRNTISMNLIGLILLGILGFGGVWAVIHLDISRLETLTDKAAQLRDGKLDVEVPELEREDEIGELYGTFEGMRGALEQQIEEAKSARKEAEVSRARAERMSEHLEERAEEYSVTMQHCAAGDLTRRMERDDENEAMDQIASEFNDMIGELEKTTGQLTNYVDEVEEAGEEVEQSAATVREASEQVADSTQTIAADAEQQQDRLHDIAETMTEIAEQLESVAEQSGDDVDVDLERIQSVSEELDELADLSAETKSETDNVSAAAQEQAAELNEVSQRAEDLQRYATPLREILDQFETEAQHEFVFSIGPTGSPARADGEDD